LDLVRKCLATNLRQPHIMGSLYRFMWVDKVGHSYFIIIATNLEDGYGRGKPVLAWAVRKKRKMSLKEICIDVLKDAVETKEDIVQLGLPRCLEEDLCLMFKKVL